MTSLCRSPQWWSLPAPAGAPCAGRLAGRRCRIQRFVFSAQRRDRGEPSMSLLSCWCLPLVLLGFQAETARLPLRVTIDESPPHAVRLYGLPAEMLSALQQAEISSRDWQDVYRVEVAGSEQAQSNLPPVAGSYRVEADHIVFVPRFALQRGQPYRVRVWPNRLKGAPAAWPGLWQDVLILPDSDVAPRTRVVAIYPSSDLLPENQLKFYIHFSQPMRRGEAYRHIRLLDNTGHPVPYPFLELPEELWDPSQQRFTLLLDPGRIKRGLKPREEFGPILESGNSYTLLIDAQWKDAAGRPLIEGAAKKFRVTEPDEQQPNLESWKLRLPRAGSREALEVLFDEALDHGLLQRMIWITDATDSPVPGQVEILRKETVWRFVPENPWMAGPYQLCVDARLEDLAGNSLARPFEVDLFERVEVQSKADVRRRLFRVEP